MKKFMIPMLMLCLGFAGMTKAANTDISTLDNVIYVEPFSVKQGTQVQMSIKMKNSAAIRGFQFDMYLPDGVNAAKSAKGKILASLTGTRLPDEDEHTLTLSEQSDGSIRFLCGSMADETFTGTDGEIVKLTINVDGETANGDYPVRLKNMKLTETDISNYYEHECIETTLTINPAGYIILDETSTTFPEAANDVNVMVKRTISAGNWNTICLPFSMTTEQTKAAFGEDVQLADFNGYDYDEDADVINVKFNSATAIEANHPYLIKVNSAVTEFSVDGVNIAPEEEPTVATVTRTKRQWSEMVGTYVANTIVPEETLFLNNNKFWYSTGNTKMKGYRAYFDFYDVLSEVEGAEAHICICIDNNETTGISKVESDANRCFYNLNGQRVEVVRKGLYITNGKKMVVK